MKKLTETLPVYSGSGAARESAQGAGLLWLSHADFLQFFLNMGKIAVFFAPHLLRIAASDNSQAVVSDAYLPLPVLTEAAI